MTLKGKTLLRFTKAFLTGGGIEQHLSFLDKELLNRNEMTIVKMYIAHESDTLQPSIRDVGKGKLILYPMKTIFNGKDGCYSKRKKSSLLNFSILRELLLLNPGLTKYITNNYNIRTSRCSKYYHLENAGSKIQKIINEYNANLLILHQIGTADIKEITCKAKEIDIPFIFINHFSNNKFLHMSTISQINEASAIAGVTGHNVPLGIRNKFVQVLNGIDIQLYKREASVIHGSLQSVSCPIIFYPARITEVKGHSDLLLAFKTLCLNNQKAHIVFAGKTESQDYYNKLHELAEKLDISDKITFLGEIDQKTMRNVYASSSVLAFPTYHDEGLPRVMLEAQAMLVPPVVYNVGGTPEALINKKTGYLIPKGNINKLALRISQLISNNELRIRMGLEGRKFIEKQFSITSLAIRHEKLYLQTLIRHLNLKNKPVMESSN